MATQVIPERRGMWNEFKDFVNRGNVVDLAVAIVLGIAFGLLVNAFIDGIIMPLIAAIFGEPNFDALVADVGDGRILYGTVITALVEFLIIAAAVFFVVKMYQRLQRPTTVDVTDTADEQTMLLREIRDLLLRERMQR